MAERIDAKKELKSLRLQRGLLPRFQKVTVIAMPYIIVLMALGIIFLTTKLASTSYEVKQTASYTRVSNCIVAKVANPPTSQEDVEQCYQQVEKDSGQKLERFDEQTHGEDR